MAQVLAFPGAKKPESQEEPAQAEVRQESHTEPQPEKPVEKLKSPAYVRVRADVFQDMLNALNFYAGFGWDDGKKARKVLNDAFVPEPPAA